MTLRIISGKRRGAHLRTLPGSTTRPLRDRIRESLFNMLRPELPEAVCLDAFAGSGAIGFEAISNGARYVQFVESDSKAARILRANGEKLGFEESMELIVGRAPGAIGTPSAPFDFLFLMPPYHSGLCEEVMNAPSVLSQSAPHALTVCEIHREEAVPETSHWELAREKKYGITRLLFFRRAN